MLVWCGRHTLRRFGRVTPSPTLLDGQDVVDAVGYHAALAAIG